ncbi:PREDICTED: uncharacterized protein LOC105565567 [Vollenhovia emeryi]|uniref:uncharacterized protein LOC105565567 n=1 Tax=Vollenhovia emeryi TaxID=411798 RepID=UPI0005F4B4C3|nr:PREDICTED: uncharacterized protein LOC105565567 [Vollenhovia emeryi]
MKMKYLLFAILILTTTTLSFGIDLEDLYDWKYVDFLWEDEMQKDYMVKSGKYDPQSCVLYDVDRAPDGRIFVTSVREEGVPASLMTVSKKRGPGGPLLEPYPDWSWYRDNDCSGIISVYRVAIKCNMLYVLDCGKVGENAVCPPKLLIFNLKSNMPIKRIIIPPNIAENKNGTGLLVTPLVYTKGCHPSDDVTVFMADIEGYGLAIYNKNSDVFCRIESDYMKPTNPYFTIENESFYLEDGILGLTNIRDKLFYSPLAGNDIYKMNIYDIPKECLEHNESQVDKSTQLAGTLSGQTAAIASEQCAIFFSDIPETSILCQDATKEFNSTNTELIVQNAEKLQFASGMKVTNRGEKLMILTNRFQRVFDDTLNLNETNFRILAVVIDQIRQETNCFASCENDHKPGNHGHGHHGHWHHGHGHRGHGHPRHGSGKPWYGKPWYGKPWYGKPWYGKPGHSFDKHYKYDKHDLILLCILANTFVTRKMRHALFLVLILTITSISFGVDLNVDYTWKYIDFTWSSNRQKQIAIDSKNYSVNACIPFDVDKAPDGRIFVTLVRDAGVPTSLTTISNKPGEGGPLLSPYPDWSWYRDFNCSAERIISVYRVSIKCNFLFALDCGKFGERAYCPPRLLIFDLTTDRLVKIVPIPLNIAENKDGIGLLVTSLVYTPNCKCIISNPTVFMADIQGWGLVKYENEKFCRIESTSMKPTNPNFTINGQSFYLEDGILGLANYNTDLFYSLLGGDGIYKMDMCKLKDCSQLGADKADKLTKLVGRPSQTGPIASEQCAIFFSNVSGTSISCKDAKSAPTDIELIAKDSKKLQFTSGMKVITNQIENGESQKELIILTNRLQRAMTNTLDPSEINFRIITMEMEQIWKQTNCFASCKDPCYTSEHYTSWYDTLWDWFG